MTEPSTPPRGAPIITAASSFGTPTTSNVTVFTPTTVDVDAYNHGCKLFTLPGSSRIYLWWLTAPRNEDSAGTRVVGSYSDNNGASWTSPATIYSSFEAPDVTGEVDCNVQILGEVRSVGSRSFLFGEVHFIVWASSLQTSRTSIGNYAAEITGGTPGAAKWLVGSGLGLSSWTGSDKDMLIGVMSSPGFSTPAINLFRYPKIAEGYPDMMIESTNYKYAYGWIRVGRGYNPITGVSLSSFLYTQWSRDGVVWSSEQVTSIAHSPSLISSIKMNNGKYVLMWNPDVDRNKLVMAVGTDGLAFGTGYEVRSGTGTTPTYSGAYKGGGAAYPSILELSNGHLLVAYSIKKETVAVTEVTVP